MAEASLVSVRLHSRSPPNRPSQARVRSTTQRRGALRIGGCPGCAAPPQPTAGATNRPAYPIGPDDPQPWEPAQQLGQAWRRPGPGCWQHEPPHPGAGPWCPLRCGVCVRQPFYRHHNPAAPFFRGLHRLAVDDGPAGRGFPSRRFPDPDAQRFLYPFPRPVRPLPVPQGGRSWGIRRQGMPPRSTSCQLPASPRSWVPSGLPATRAPPGIGYLRSSVYPKNPWRAFGAPWSHTL